MKLGNQILLLALAILAFLVVSLDVILPSRLQPYLIEQFVTELKQEAVLIRSVLETSIQSDQQMRDYANRVGSLLGRRVTIIAPDGTVIGDNSADSARMENHNGRPEVRQARAEGLGKSVRYSSTLAAEMLYVAVPFQTPGGETGVARISLEYRVIQQALSELRRVIYGLSLLAFLVAGAFAYLLSHGISRSAQALARTARTVASGGLEARASVKGPQELRALGRAFNQMTEQLVSQVRDNAAERQKLRTILDGMREGVVMVDAQARVEFINPACLEILGPRRPVEGRNFIEVVRQLELETALLATLSGQGSQKLEIELPHSHRNLLVSLHPVPREGGMESVVVVLRDVTELRKLENVREEFVANVSHELRTPLTSIRGYAETLLQETGLDEGARQEFLSIIHKHATQLSDLIEDLLQLSTLESHPVLDKAPVDVGKTAQSVVRSMRNLMENKSLHCAVETDSNAVVQANQRAMEQVFFNLLDNAVKYTPAGGSVAVRIAQQEGKIRVAVSDTGIGIPAEDQPRIFERFYRVDKSRSREMGGTGLGLAIVKHILQLHGGTIRVESEPDKGSTFTFELPAA